MESTYSSYSFSTSALDKGEWSASRPGERNPVPIVQEAGWAPDLDTEATAKIIPPLPGIEPRSPGRPAVHYSTNYKINNLLFKMKFKSVNKLITLIVYYKFLNVPS
jgi:hypothetical protein